MKAIVFFPPELYKIPYDMISTCLCYLEVVNLMTLRVNTYALGSLFDPNYQEKFVVPVVSSVLLVVQNPRTGKDEKLRPNEMEEE